MNWQTVLENFIRLLDEYDGKHGTWYAYYLNGMPRDTEEAITALLCKAWMLVYGEKK